MPTEIVARCAKLRDIVFLGTGPQSYMDLEALRGLGVAVHAIKGYGDTAVAEHAIALMFACARDLAGWTAKSAPALGVLAKAYN